MFVAGAAVGLAIGIPGGAWIVSDGHPGDVATAPRPVTSATYLAEPLEDDPAFDCRIHGNHICGPGAVLPDGSPAYPGDYSGARMIMVGQP
jgi:hypothetical protein